MNYFVGPYLWDGGWRRPPNAIDAIDLRNESQMGTPITQAGVGFFSSNVLLPGYTLLGTGDLRDINSTAMMKSAWQSELGYTPKGGKLVDLLYDHMTMGSDPTGIAASKAMIPDGKNIRLYFGSHGLVKSKQFSIGHSPESNQVLSVYQNDYSHIRDSVLSGDLPPDHHRKVLDYWGHEFNVKDPENLFVPANLPKETRLPHSTQISEDFNGDDQAQLGHQLTWVEGGDGTFWSNLDNNGKALKVPSSSNWDDPSSYPNSALSGTNQKCIIEVEILTGPGPQAGPCCRRSNTVITFYCVTWEPAEDNFMDIIKVVTGTRTFIGTTTGLSPPPATPRNPELQVMGNSLKSLMNGSEVETITDVSITGNLFCGLYGRRTAAGDSLEINNWSAEDISVAVPTGASLLMGLI